MRTLFAVLLALFIVRPSDAQSQVLVFPIEFVDIAPYPDVSRIIASTLERGGKLPAEIEQSINLTEYRDRCAGEDLCLVQIGQLVDAESVIVIRARRGISGLDSLSLRALETSSGKILKKIAWEVESGSSSFNKALHVGLRQLLYEPDASVVFDVSPKRTTISLYGKPVGMTESGESVPLWSGEYALRAEAPGYETETRWFNVEPGSFHRELVRLKANSAFIAEQSNGYLPRPQVSQKIKRPDKSPLSEWLAWGLFAGGAISLGGGSLSMYSANQSFVELAQQNRNFSGNENLLSAQEATSVRDELSSDYDNGRYIAIAGGVALFASTMWILIENLGEVEE
ncbi:MAG: hypothetical protein VYC39_19625 [Myxococcota bacterium]|nr:hypothetical protein [Myxococcota bacterium]